MFASKPSVRPACSALLAHTLAACALIEPVSPDAQLPNPDAGPGVAAPSEADGLSELLATEPPPAEARGAGREQNTEQPVIAPDAPPRAADAGRESAADADARCDADWQCAAGEYCSRVRGLCSARCQGETCLGPTISDANDRVVSDGARVCFADDSEAPGSGDFALRTWDGAEPRAITLTRAHEVRALLLDSHYCYFHAAGALRRAALSGGCVELLQEMAQPPSRIWIDEAHVSWNAAVGEFYRVAAQQNARAERVEPEGVPTSENTYATSATVGEHLIQRHAAEGRLQATRNHPSADAIR